MKLQTAMRSGMNKRKAQAGVSLLETMIALGLLLIVAVGLMGLATYAMTTTENQGHLAARTAEYAQDKMEQLLALAFCNGPAPVGTDTTVFPAAAAGGTGLAGCNNGTTPPTPLAGGSLSITAPSAGYVDYLDASGNLVGGGANWKYIRVWQVTVPPGTNFMKQIDVKVQVRPGPAGTASMPQATVSVLKSYPF